MKLRPILASFEEKPTYLREVHNFTVSRLAFIVSLFPKLSRLFGHESRSLAFPHFRGGFQNWRASRPTGGGTRGVRTMPKKGASAFSKALDAFARDHPDVYPDEVLGAFMRHQPAEALRIGNDSGRLLSAAAAHVYGPPECAWCQKYVRTQKAYRKGVQSKGVDWREFYAAAADPNV